MWNIGKYYPEILIINNKYACTSRVQCFIEACQTEREKKVIAKKVQKVNWVAEITDIIKKYKKISSK